MLRTMQWDYRYWMDATSKQLFDALNRLCVKSRYKVTEIIIANNKNNKKSESNLVRAASPPLTAENNYVTKSPLFTMGCPTLPGNLFNPFRRSAPHLTHPSLDRPHLPPETAFRSNQPFCHSTPSG